MRAAFVRTLVELAERDPRVLLLTGDLGFMALEPFAERFPGRFFNMGVAEQNMVAVASGLADAGFFPFVYSIATFAALRPYEFIRNGPVAQRLPVRIVGVGGGFEYGHAGPTHHGLEDVGVTRLQPGLTVIAPADHRQTRSALQSTWDAPGPIYYRLGKNDRAVVRGFSGEFESGRVHLVGEGRALLILAMGGIAVEASEAAGQLGSRGLPCTLGIVSTVNPVPERDLLELLARFSRVMTVEAHYTIGGLGSLVSEVIAEHGLGVVVRRCGVRAFPEGETGSQDYLQRRHGLDCASLVAAALDFVGQLPGKG